MVDENKSLESEVEAKDEAPKPRGRKPGPRPKVEAKPKEETSEDDVETKDEAPESAQPEASEDKSSDEPEADAVRVIKKGEPIEVATDENSVAQETVYREMSLMGTKEVSLVQVAIEGTYYRKG